MEPRKTATLLARARRLEAAAVDDALDLFDSLMATRLISPARRATDKARLAANDQQQPPISGLAGKSAFDRSPDAALTDIGQTSPVQLNGPLVTEPPFASTMVVETRSGD